MKVLKFSPWGLIGESVVPTTYEKAIYFIVGGSTEVQNNLKH